MFNINEWETDAIMCNFIDSAYRRQTQQAIKESDESFEKMKIEYLKLHLPEEYKKEKIKVLAKERDRLLAAFMENRKAYINISRSGQDEWALGGFEDCAKVAIKKIKSCEARIAILKGKRKARIDDDMIARAKEYPIEDIIEVKRKFAKCISHDERTPSMSIKNNRAYCFGCNWKGSSIDVYMKVHDCSFVEAVTNMQ
jgi:hypothetical protein